MTTESTHSADAPLRTQLRRILLVMLGCVVLYGAFVAVTGFGKIRDSLSTFDWSALGVALGLSCINYALRILKWEYYLHLLGIRGVGKLDSALIFLSGFVLTVTPGKVGEVFKSAVMADTHGVAPERTAPIVIAERLTDVIGVVALILIGSVTFNGGVWWGIAGASAVGVGLLFIFWERPTNALLRKMETGWGRGLVPKLRAAWLELRKLATPRALLLPSLLSVLGWGCEGVALGQLLKGFHQSVPLAQAGFFYATATLAGALVPLPGGLGIIETLIQQQLVRLGGVAVGAATASMLLIRLTTLWWAVLVGFIALGLLKLRFPSLLTATPPPDR